MTSTPPTVTLPAGHNKIEVIDISATANSFIFTMPTSNPGAAAGVTALSWIERARGSFTLHFTNTAQSDMTIEYFIVPAID